MNEIMLKVFKPESRWWISIDGLELTTHILHGISNVMRQLHLLCACDSNAQWLTGLSYSGGYKQN